ncbi:hypothetical protein VFPFJ_09376 [Purpureocillium lilacinum]|uniref:Uncharacterized protein n=1 Tax=Purpureocillium lilacinum TaxID=33203 RepID=A0A179GUF3_PURLI|nr:hypothetical protein VFPFJ_09376 [Purpureocillium lilacinum]OAQ80923.1 hypothetical protein VFPFJ_09376 [Purpureocillium lilacinum]
MRLAAFLALASLATLGSTDVLDLGDLKQYNARTDVKAPTLSGNTIWLSGRDNEGYDVVLSPDTQAKARGILEGCGKADNKCYNDVRNFLQTSHVEIDGQLERRGFLQLLTKTFRKLGSVFGFIAAAMIADWQLRHNTQPPPLFVPHNMASSASKLSGATGLVISAQGTPVVTVTQTAAPTSLQGTQTPSVTPVTEPHDNFAKGDISVVLQSDFARRVDEIMHRMTNCEDGYKFDKGSTRRRKRVAGSYGKAICAAEAAAMMAQSGGALNDFVLMNPTQLRFSYTDSVAAVARAANIVNEFIREYAALVDISAELATQLSNVLFGLALRTIVDGTTLGENNRIPASLIKVSASPTGSHPSSTATGCPDPEKNPLTCGTGEKDDCKMRAPKKPGDSPVCDAGEHKDCECSAGVIWDIETVSDAQQKAMLAIAALHKKLGGGGKGDPKPGNNKPDCNPYDLSVIPSNVFRNPNAPEKNVYHHFCEKWYKESKLEMTVDAAGNNKKPEPHLKSVIKRTPPPDPSNWSKYDFNLSFKPAEGKKECAMDCKAAYALMSTACSNSGAMSVPMSKGGKLDVGCGVFDYSISEDKNIVPLKAQDRHCFAPDEFGKHRDIHPGSVSSYSGWPCTGTALKPVRRGDDSTFIKFKTTEDDVAYQYSVVWKQGCSLDSGVDAIYASNPLAIKDPGHTACQQTFIDNYKECLNGGIGGNIQIGCLVYEFKAQPA